MLAVYSPGGTTPDDPEESMNTPTSLEWKYLLIVDERERDLLPIADIIRTSVLVDKIERELFLSYFNLPPFL